LQPNVPVDHTPVVFLQKAQKRPIIPLDFDVVLPLRGWSLSPMNLPLPLLTAGWARLARCVSLSLLPALVSESTALASKMRSAAPAVGSKMHSGVHRMEPSVPYLRLVLPPPLRFQDPPPPIETLAHLAAGASPFPGGTQEELAAANRDAIAPAGEHQTGATSGAADPIVQEDVILPAGAPKRTANPVSILPDDTPRNVGAEDVLPFFQFPDVPPVPSSPSTLPPSSATYRQR